MTDQQKNAAANDLMAQANLAGGLSVLAGGDDTELGKRLAKRSHNLTIQAIDLVQAPPSQEVLDMTDDELVAAFSDAGL